MNILNVEKDGYRKGNTAGFTQSQLDALNNELENRLSVADVNTGDPEYFDIIHTFEDEVARR